jgi:D-inositol-3-phosphate glycosyltransferase
LITRVAILGPVEPFRSGVARHTTALASALAARTDTTVRVFSFSRQYPSLLFPGESDRAEEQPCPNLDARYVLDSMNPLTWLATARSVANFRPDLVVAPVWTFFLAPCLFAVQKHLAHRDIPIVAIVHNIADHDGSAFRSWLTALQLRQASAHVTHTSELAAEISKLVPGTPLAVCPHPVFNYPRASGRLSKRRDLELLMFGLVRPYKGVDVLLRALALVAKPSVMLSIVGEVWDNLEKLHALIDGLDLRSKVELIPHYVSDADAAEYFDRSDVVVLPYRSVTGSGVLPLAYHYGKPVLVSRLPGLTELVQHGKTGWVVPPEDPLALARALDGDISRQSAAAMGIHIADMRRSLSFERLAETVLEAGRQVRHVESSTERVPND